MLTLTFTAGEATPASAASRQVNVWYNERGDCCARAFIDGPVRRIEWLGLGSFEFQQDSLDVVVTPAHGVSRDLIVDTFSRLVQPVILQARGWPVLHASAVLTPSGVLGFCARSGSGKSTLAFALQTRGFEQFADDALVLSIDRTAVTAHALPFRARLRPEASDYFRQSGNGARNVAASVGTTAPLAALFLVTRNQSAGAATEIARVPSHSAFSAILTHAHCFDPEDAPATARLVSDYLTISRNVPIIECRYQPGWQYLPRVVDQILAAGTAPTPCER